MARIHFSEATRFYSWCDELDAGLDIAVGEDKEIIKEQVNKGLAEAYKVGDIYLTLFIDNKDLVVQCLQGKGVTKELGDFLIEIAKMHGLKFIRAHSQKESVMRLYRRVGFEMNYFETVYKKAVFTSPGEVFNK